MFKNNPFQLLCDFIQNYVQKFVLYMLDHYGILVSRWAWSVICLDFVHTFYVFVMTPFLNKRFSLFDAIPLAFLLIILTIVYRITTVQIKHEKAGAYKQYEFHRSYWDVLFWKGVMIVIFLLTLPTAIQSVVYDTNLSNIGFLAFKIYGSHFAFFLSCYTRDREPPMKTAPHFAT